MNRLLTGAGIQYLFSVTDDARAELFHRALAVADPDIKQRTAHAIALYRGRGAVIAPAGILEERRDLIGRELGKPDDSALIATADKFEIRYRDASQQVDYDPAFLDWIFW